MCKALPALLLLILFGCKTATYVGYSEPVEKLIESREATDCSDHSGADNIAFAQRPRRSGPAIGPRFQEHYKHVSDQILRAEALRMLTQSDRSVFSNDTIGTDSTERYTESEISVYVHTENQSHQQAALRAISSFNRALETLADEGATIYVEGTPFKVLKYVKLVPFTGDQHGNSGRQSVGGNAGIHIYFGSRACMWKVFEEQGDVKRTTTSEQKSKKLKRLGGVTLNQKLTVDGVPSGRILRSLVVILNLSDPQLKQHIIEHELLHALGVRGHATKIFWTRMSEISGTYAPPAGITQFDKRLLQLLYSLEPGASHAAVKELVDNSRLRPPGAHQDATAPCLKKLVERQNSGEQIPLAQLFRGLSC